MNRYVFTVKETYERTICVHADSSKAAYEALSGELEQRPLSDLNIVDSSIKIAQPRNLKCRSIIDCTSTANNGAEITRLPRFEFVANGDKLSLAYFKYGLRANTTLLIVDRHLRWGLIKSISDVSGTYASILVYDRALTEQECTQYQLEFLGAESIDSFYKIKK